MTLQSIPVVYFLFVFYFDICNVACGGKNMFSLRTERVVSVFQCVEELSVSIWVLVVAIDVSELQENSGFMKPLV